MDPAIRGYRRRVRERDPHIERLRRSLLHMQDAGATFDATHKEPALGLSLIVDGVGACPLPLSEERITAVPELPRVPRGLPADRPPGRVRAPGSAHLVSTQRRGRPARRGRRPRGSAAEPWTDCRRRRSARDAARCRSMSFGVAPARPTGIEPRIAACKRLILLGIGSGLAETHGDGQCARQVAHCAGIPCDGGRLNDPGGAWSSTEVHGMALRDANRVVRVGAIPESRDGHDQGPCRGSVGVICLRRGQGVPAYRRSGGGVSGASGGSC